MPSSVLIIDRPSAPASTQARATSTMSVTSGESWLSTGTDGAVCRRTARDHADAAPGSQAKTRPRFSTFGQEMLTSSADQPGAPRSRRASSAYSSTLPPGDRHDGAGALLVQPGQVVLEERVDARALEPDRVEHAAGGLGHPRGRPAGPGCEHDRLGDDRAEVGDVEELAELATRGGAPGRGEHRVGQQQPAEPGGQVDGRSLRNDGTLVGALGITEMALGLAGIPHKKGGTQAAIDYLITAHAGEKRAAAE